MTEKLIYEELQPISHIEAEAGLASDNSKEIGRILIRIALHDEDPNWIQCQCIPFLEHQDVWVRRNALTCLLHVVRIHKQLNLEKVKPILNRLKNDNQVKSWVEDLIEHIELFC